MSEHQQQQPQGQSQGQPQVIVIENVENNICKEIKKTGLNKKFIIFFILLVLNKWN